MAARAGLLIMVTVDAVMCGWVSADELAFYGIALVPQLALVLIGIGLLMGTVVVTAQLDGGGRQLDCGRVWRLALINALLIGIVFGLLLLPGGSILEALGQDSAITAGGGGAVVMFAYGMPGIMLFVASSAFLEGISRPMPTMVVMALANLLNIVLNVLFLFGPFELGAEGAALATSITRTMMGLMLTGYILLMPARDQFGVFAKMAGAWHLQSRLIHLGWPMAFSFALEHGAFFAAATFAGWLGTVSLAAYQIVLNTMALIYMLAIGIAVATGVRVGNAVGRGDRQAMRVSGWTGVAIGTLLMVLLMPVLSFGGDVIARIYTDDPAVVRLATLGLAIASWILVADACQGILVGALRGAADIWPTLMIQTGSFWGVSIPLCYFFSFYANKDIIGLLVGLFFGLAMAALLLGWRFARLSKQGPVDRIMQDC